MAMKRLKPRFGARAEDRAAFIWKSSAIYALDAEVAAKIKATLDIMYNTGLSGGQVWCVLTTVVSIIAQGTPEWEPFLMSVVSAAGSMCNNEEQHIPATVQ